MMAFMHIAFFALIICCGMTWSHADDHLPGIAALPAEGKIWNVDDYLRLAKLLNEGVELPELGKPQGVKLLRGMTANRNIEALLNSNTPAAARLASGKQIAQVVSSMLLKYRSKLRVEDKYHSEITMLIAFTLRLDAVPFAILAVSPEEPSLKRNREALAKDAGQCLLGAATQLCGAWLFSDESIVLLLDAINEFSGSCGTYLSEKDRASAIKFLGRAKSVLPEKHHKRYDQVLTSLQRAK